MNTIWKSSIAGAVCLGLAAVATVGVAQDRPAAPAAGARAPGRPGMDRTKMMEAMRARREQKLHDLLQIKPDQDGAFKAYLAALAPPQRTDGRGVPGAPGQRRGPDAAPMTTPQRLDMEATRMADRQARFQKLAAATKTFYAALTPDQRKAFDAMPMMGGRGGGMRGGMHGGWQGGFRGGPGGPGGPGAPPPR